MLSYTFWVVQETQICVLALLVSVWDIGSSLGEVALEASDFKGKPSQARSASFPALSPREHADTLMAVAVYFPRLSSHKTLAATKLLLSSLPQLL